MYSAQYKFSPSVFVSTCQPFLHVSSKFVILFNYSSDFGLFISQNEDLFSVYFAYFHVSATECKFEISLIYDTF